MRSPAVITRKFRSGVSLWISTPYRAKERKYTVSFLAQTNQQLFGVFLCDELAGLFLGLGLMRTDASLSGFCVSACCDCQGKRRRLVVVQAIRLV